MFDSINDPATLPPPSARGVTLAHALSVLKPTCDKTGGACNLGFLHVASLTALVLLQPSLFSI